MLAAGDGKQMVKVNANDNVSSGSPGLIPKGNNSLWGNQRKIGYILLLKDR